MKRVTLILAMGTMFGCAGPKEAEDPHLALQDEPAPSAPRAITRAEVNRAVDAGLGQLLARADLNPVLRAGAFVGFEIRSFDTPADLARLGLQPGDILCAAQGKPIRTPDEAQLAFEALRDAKAIELDVERGAIRRRISQPIAP